MHTLSSSAGLRGRLGPLALALSFMFSSAVVMPLAGCQKPPTSAGGASSDPTHFNAVDITGADYARRLDVPDVDGRVRHLSDFKGKVVFVFFGFTQCPDVCPTTMAELAEVKRRLGADGARVQGVFITIDPERDTPQVLKAYLQGMDPSFIGLRGDLAQTEDLAHEFKVFYQKVPTKSGYTMDHTAAAYIFDPEGHVRLFARYGMGADALTSDIRQLLGLGGAASAPTGGASSTAKHD